MTTLISMGAIRSISVSIKYEDSVPATKSLIALIDLIAVIVQFVYHAVFSTLHIVQPLTLINHTNTIRYTSVHCCNIVNNADNNGRTEQWGGWIYNIRN